MSDIPSFCPKGSRIYIITAVSLFLTATVISTAVFNGHNNSDAFEAQYHFLDNDGNKIKSDYYYASSVISALSCLYLVYILGVSFFEETWETTGLSQLINYRYIIEGGLDVNPNQLKAFAEDVPCYKRKSANTCDAGDNPRECFWDNSRESCTRTYTGGYANFVFFMMVSIYLIVFGSMIINDHDEYNTSDEYINLATASIIIGCIGILYSLIDLVIC